MPNLLIAGLPRSGTTLTCELLGSLADTVALDEPLSGTMLTDSRARLVRGIRPMPPRAVALRNVHRFLDTTRQRLRRDGTAPSKVVAGRVESRKVSDEVDEHGLRIRLARMGEVHVDKSLSADFTLVVKHHAGFVALLPQLAEQFPVHAIVRNPLAILSSWQTVPFHVRDGRANTAERINPGLGVKLDTLSNATDRQFYLLAWLFDAILSSLPKRCVTRYEDIIKSGGRALAGATSRAAGLNDPLEDRNETAPYEADRVCALGRRLLSTEGPWRELYQNEEIELMMSSFTAPTSAELEAPQ